MVDEIQIELNYESEELSNATRQLRPVVLKKDDEYLCLLGANPLSGIAGYGHTILEAISDWEASLVLSIVQNSKRPIVKLAKQELLKNKDELK